MCCVQAAVELVLGFEKSWVTEENLAINQARFLAWTDAFNGTPLDLPGFSKHLYRSTHMKPYQLYQPPRLPPPPPPPPQPPCFFLLPSCP